MFITKGKYGIGAVILLTALALTLVVTSTSTRNISVKAQESNMDIRDRLEELRAESDAGNLLLGIQFIMPVSEETNYWLFGDVNDQRRLTILEIEEDHFCFSETGGQAVLIRCVPYTNIASF
ncbi:MAG: hypothetical protein AAGK74_21685, partial [Chloroflexota bacterium]